MAIRSVQDVFSDMPDVMRAILEKGFQVLAKVPSEHTEYLVELSVQGTGSPESLRPEIVAEKLKIEGDQARQLLAALFFLGGFVAEGREETSDFIRIATEAGVLGDAEGKKVLTLLGALSPRRAVLESSFRALQLANELLPSFTHASTTVELRLAFEDKQIVSAVPIVLMRIQTDSRTQQIWFQMTRAQLASLIEELQQTLDRADKAETWNPLHSRNG